MSGATRASTTHSGNYVVHFDRDVIKSAYAANLGSTKPSGITPSGWADVTVTGQSNSVLVGAYEQSGRARTGSFHLVVAC